MERLLRTRAARLALGLGVLYFQRQVSRSAAHVAYFLILSLFPVLICVHALVGILELEAADLLALTQPFLPGGVEGLLADYLGYVGQNSSGMLTAGLAMTLFSASAAFRALMGAMDELWGRRRFTGLTQIAVSLLCSVLLLVTVYVSGILLLTGDRLLGLFRLSWPRLALPFCLALLFLLLVYRLCAPRPVPVLPGGAAAAVALGACSWGFSAVVSLSGRYSLVYGSLASVMLLLVWLYLCGNIVLLGHGLNFLLHSGLDAPGKKC